MPVYVYQGRDRTGKIVSGEKEGKNETILIAFLRQQGIIPISIRIKPKQVNLSTLFFLRQKVKAEEIVVFTRQLSTMINAGLPIVQCLVILEEQTENKRFAKVIKEIRTAVEGGSTLAEALSKHPAVFEQLFVPMIEAGEVGGVLDVVLNRLAGYLEKANALKKKVKGAMVYPMFVSIFALIMIVVMMICIIPTFKTMFEDFEAKLPFLTQALLNISDFTKKFFVFIAIAFFGLIQSFNAYKKTAHGMKQIDKISLFLPIFGKLLRKVAIAKFTRTLGTLISSGVSILDSLAITAKTAGNKIIEGAILKSRLEIQEGKTIAEPLKNTKVFPQMVCQMIAVGEETGALDEMLNKIADFYDQEVNATVEILTSILEPIMLILLGLVVGIVIIALFLPILTLVGSMKID